ncbi:MAG: hypothetical protein GXX96_13655 [Planctomycetaceae bacterium]|nr:hypothetical protein [Planctomycetaceae bacterium]
MNDAPRVQGDPGGTREHQPTDGQRELRTLLEQLIRRKRPAANVELRHLRSLLESAAPSAESLRVLDAVLDSPLDVDTSILEMLLSTVRSANRSLQRQTQRIEHARLAFEQQRAGRRCEAVSATDAAERPASSVEATVRGLHVRQGGHDFVIPIEVVERALAAEVRSLPTVCGRKVTSIAGEVCDVVLLSEELGLPATDSSAGTLLVIATAGRRVCLAIDEVLGPVKASVTTLDRILPGVPHAVDMATLESGALALVPDFSRLFR